MTNIALAAMLGGWEILLILCVVLFVPVVVAIGFFIVWLVRRAKKERHETAPPMIPPATERLPRRCPQCGSQLKADVPEGLCPSCLLQRGIATEGGVPAGQPAFVPPTIAELARLFPQLEIIEAIGKGGMGAVYKARQPALDRFVALKILAPRPGNELDFASRFSREARALARLSHPNIVAVYDFGVVSGISPDATRLSYFIMEFVDGPNLRQVQQAGRLAPREALEIIPQICTALQFAHDEGIVHRDIKPENVLLDKKGRVKIADFGLAKILGQEAKDFRLTGARDVMGTPHYMAPEQVENPQEVDHRADIFSLGVVFYEMLTGELPLGRFQPPSARVQVDVRFDEVVMRALEKEPGRRYQHVSEVKQRVETIAGSPGAGDSPAMNMARERGNAGRGAGPDSKVNSRFSRLAIAGACWVPLFFAATSFLAFEPRRVPFPYSYKFIAMLPVLVGLAGFLGTTILGWVAVAQIRRSAGRLWGMGLAVFDGLFFPLLLIDSLIIGLGILIARLFQSAGHTAALSHGSVPIWFNLAFVLILLGSLGLAILIDFLIVHRIWHAVSRPKEALLPERKPDHFWRRFAVVMACVILIPIAIAVAGILIAIALPGFAKARRHVQERAAVQAPVISAGTDADVAAEQDSNFMQQAEASPGTPVLLAFEGATVEFVEVSTWTGTNQLTWYPNGAPATNIEETLATRTGFPPSRIIPTRAFRFPSALSGRDETKSFQFTFRVKGSGSPNFNIDGQRVVAWPRPVFGIPGIPGGMETLWVCESRFPTAQKEVDLDVSLPEGPWLVDEPITGFQNGELTGVRITCGGLKWNVNVRLQETNGWLRLTGSHPLYWSEGWSHQLALLSGSGSIYRYYTNESVLNHGTITLNEVNETFKNLVMADVADVRFRIRPYQRFRPGNVSLQAGHFTTVTVTNVTPWKKLPTDFKVERLSLAAQAISAPEPANSSLAFRWVARESETNLLVDELPDPSDRTGNLKLRVLRNVLLNDSAIAAAVLSSDDQNRREINLVLTESGRKGLSDLTGANVGRQLAIVWNERVLVAPMIATRISGPSLTISGSFNQAEAESIATALNQRSGNVSSETGIQVNEVVERTIFPASNRTNSFIDFDTGRILLPPIGLNLRDRRALWGWAETNGIDAIADDSPQIRGFLVFGRTFVRVSDSDWDNATAMTVEEAVAEYQSLPGSEPMELVAISANALSTDPKRSRTFAFRTRENRLGILQLLEVADERNGFVRFRYKLLGRGGVPNSVPVRPDESVLRDLNARFDAAREILAFTEKDSAMAALARDAAATGEVSIVRKALDQMTAFTVRDEATREAARRLAVNGHRAEALELARTITAFTIRDATLRELADK
jgi:hypothetical protein